MKPTAEPPVPLWLFDEQQALRAFASFDTRRPSERDRARKLFHASFRRLS